MSPAEIKAKFIERDKAAVDEMNGYWNDPSESSRLAFLEGRVKDLCGLVIWLLDYAEAAEVRAKDRYPKGGDEDSAPKA